MHPRLARTVLVVLLLALTSVLSPTASARTDSPNLVLHAVDPVADSGIADLAVSVHRWDGAAWTLTGDTGTTDALGRAGFTVPDGSYWISFEDPWDRYGDTKDLPESASAPEVLVVGDGSTQTRFDRSPRIKGYRAVVVTGHLVNSRGDSVAGRVVLADGVDEGISPAASRSGAGGPLYPDGPYFDPGVFALAVEPGDNRIVIASPNGAHPPIEIGVMADDDLDLGDIDVEDHPGQAASTTTAKLVPKRVAKGERGSLEIKVVSEARTKPTGRLTVTVGPKKVSAELSEPDKGRLTVLLPKLKVGSYDVVVEYAGDQVTAPSSAEGKQLVVKAPPTRG